jgi:hypothetical protein
MTQYEGSLFSRNALRALAPLLAVASLLVSDSAAAADEDQSAWSINFTPVLIFPKGEYGWGGGADPELKYTLDLGKARLSAGARVGAYYAKNLFGLTAMPTMRMMVPVGDLEPYVAFGMGYGWLPKPQHSDVATMARLGLVYRFSAKFALGLEGTVQQIHASTWRFPSLGSMVSFGL